MSDERHAWPRHKVITRDGAEHVAVGPIAYAAIGHGAGMQMMTFTDEATGESITLPAEGTQTSRIPDR